MSVRAAATQAAVASPVVSTPLAQATGLQRQCACGGPAGLTGICQDCQTKKLLGKPLQTKLRINEPGDQYEQEADRVAEQVMRMPKADLDGLRRPSRSPSVQRQATGGGTGVMEAPSIVQDVLSSPGQPLDAATRAFFEPRFGHDFSRVRVHDDRRAGQSASDVSANAYAVGNDIVFGAGQFAPSTTAGRRLIAHELTHVVQQGGRSAPAEHVQRQPSAPPPTSPTLDPEPPVPASDEILIAGETIEVIAKAPGPPDDRQGPPVPNQKWVFKNNKAYWLQYKLDSVKPLRDFDPFATPNAYANRVYRAQKYLRAEKYVFREKTIALDGMLGPETILFLHYILQNANFSEAHFELTGLGFDREALSSAAAKIAAHQAEADEFPLKFLEEWTVETQGTAALRHIQDNGHLEEWYDAIIFGGAAPRTMHNQELTLAHRHAIMLKAYEHVVFKGLAALVEVERDVLHLESDNMTLVRRHYKKLEDLFWINYKADTKGTAAKHDTWLGLEYPTEEIRKIRKTVGTKTKRKNRTYLTGLLTPFFIPKLTEMERARLRIVASEYFRERAENIENFIVPRAEILLSLIRDTETRREIRAHKVENELMDFFAHPDVFEKFADHLAKQGSFEELVTGIERLRSVAALELFVQLCMQTAYKNNLAVLRAHEKLMSLKRDLRSHDYVAGDREAQAVILDKDPDRKLKVGEVAGGRYIISEDRQRMKPDRQQALEEKMRAMVMADIAEKMGKEDDAGGADLSADKYMEQILEKAAAELKIGEGDFEEVSYQEGYRLLGVKSVLQNGVEQFLVDYERVNRMAGGAWQTLEASSGYRPSREFEESLGWFMFANQMGTLETVIGGAAIVVGGVILLASGAGGALVALGGGAKMVALSIGISVLIWAITADHLTIEGFLQAVLDGYLMAVGFRLFSPLGKGVATLIGTATFKQKLVGLLLQSVVTGGGAGAMTGPASLLIRDILAGKLGRHSAGDYFRAAKTGFIYGALFELGGSLIVGPLMRTAGKNVLERIANIEQWKAFLEKSGIVLKPAQWGSEITKAYAGFNTWMAQNLEATIEQTIAKKFLQYSNALLESYVEGLLLTIHRQTLDLIEGGMTRESVNTLEQIITESHKKLPVPQANALVNDILNELARNPKGRVNPFFSLVNVADNASFQSMLGQGMKDLASADAILHLTTIHTPATVRSLWQYHFQGNAAEFAAWLEKAALLSKETRQEIIRLLSERGSSVTPALLLRMAQKGASVSPPVVEGLVRLTTRAKQLNIPLSRVDELLAAVSDEHLEPFLKAMNDMLPPDFDALSQRLLNKPADAGKKIVLHDTPGGGSIEASDAFDWFVKQPKVKAALDAKPKMKSLVEGHRDIVYQLMQHEPIRMHLAENPEIVESFIKHPQAVPILDDAMATLKTKGAQNVVTELRGKAKPTTSLSTPHQELSQTFASEVKRRYPDKPAQEGFDAARKDDPVYMESYLDDLYEKAKQASRELELSAESIAGKTNGEFKPRPKDEASQLPLKGRGRAKQKIRDDYENDASKLVDIAGGKIVYNTFDDLYKGLDVVKAEFGDRVVMFKDRFYDPLKSGYQDILMNVKMSNGHIAEFRMHLKAFDTAAEVEHPLYEVSRVVAPEAAVKAGRLTLEQEAIMLLIREKSQQLYAKVVADLLRTTP